MLKVKTQRFLSSYLLPTYVHEAFSPTLAVESAHCMPARSPPQGAPPRTFMAKFLNYKDLDAALRLSREKGNIPLGNIKVAIFLDFNVAAKASRRPNACESNISNTPCCSLCALELKVMTGCSFLKILKKFLPGWNVEELIGERLTN